MKYSLVLLAAAAMVSAQTTIPACAVQCIADAVKTTSCGANDIACQCLPDNKAKIQSAATPCVLAKCDATDAGNTITAANAICANPPKPATSAAPAPATSAAPAPASSAPAPASSAPAPASSAAAPATSAAAPATSVVATLSTVSGQPSPTPVTNGTVTTAPPATFTGAASQLAAGLGSVFALGVAALAAL